MKILVTGGAGFIGCNFVRYMVKKYPDYELIVLDKLTYVGRLENLQGVLDKIRFVKGDVTNEEDVKGAMKEADVVINFAAETHVDRSITDPENFIRTNLFGTYVLLEHATKNNVERYLQISSDEVYGSIANGSFKEIDPLNPSSPYAASKAGADLLVEAYHKTYGLPTLIARSSNNFGIYQHPEKLIPFFIVRALQNKPLPLYGDGMNVRDWICVEDNCMALDMVFHEGEIGEIYNIAAGNEKTNLDITRFILRKLGKPESLITFVEDRPGHDRRYSLDTQKIRKMGWKSTHEFEDALRKTIDWYVHNEWWWRPLLQ